MPVALRAALAAATMVIAAAVVGLIQPATEEASLGVSSPTPAPSVTNAPAASAAPVRTAGAVRTAPPTVKPVVTPSGPAPNASPPKTGIYTYRATTDGSATASNLRISDLAHGRQSENLDGIVTEVAWTAHGKYDDKTTFGEPPDGFTCDLVPDAIELKMPFSTNDAWDINSTCKIGSNGSLALTGHAHIAGTERVTVGGQVVETWKLITDLNVHAKGPNGTSDEKVTTDQRFAPAYGLYVLTTETHDGTDPGTGQPTHSTTTSELVSLTPGA